MSIRKPNSQGTKAGLQHVPLKPIAVAIDADSSKREKKSAWLCLETRQTPALCSSEVCAMVCVQCVGVCVRAIWTPSFPPASFSGIVG